MSISRCIVRLKDCHNTEHRVEVYAESLYEAVLYVEDLLGTSRVLTTNTGVVCYDADFYPYGGERAYTNTCPQNYKFEGKERDTETLNDDFGARFDSTQFGRWISPDIINLTTRRLVNPSNTLNKYTYGADNPLKFVDRDGEDITIFYRAPS